MPAHEWTQKIYVRYLTASRKIYFHFRGLLSSKWKNSIFRVKKKYMNVLISEFTSELEQKG